MFANILYKYKVIKDKINDYYLNNCFDLNNDVLSVRL